MNINHTWIFLKVHTPPLLWFRISNVTKTPQTFASRSSLPYGRLLLLWQNILRVAPTFMSASETPKSRLEMSSCVSCPIAVRRPERIPPPVPFWNMSCSHLSGICWGCRDRDKWGIFFFFLESTVILWQCLGIMSSVAKKGWLMHSFSTITQHTRSSIYYGVPHSLYQNTGAKETATLLDQHRHAQPSKCPRLCFYSITAPSSFLNKSHTGK